MKNVKVWLMSLCFCACVLFSMEVSAESDYVYDYADLLTVEEEDALQKSAEFCKEQWNMNFLVVTTDDAEGKSSRAYADDFYDQRFPEESEEDGVLYLIDMDNREIYLFTSGEAIRYLTDSRIDRILDEVSVQVSEDSEQLSEYVKKLLDVMEYDIPYTRLALMEKLGLKSNEGFRRNYLHPAIELNLVRMTIPEKPNSRNQRYIKV